MSRPLGSVPDDSTRPSRTRGLTTTMDFASASSLAIRTVFGTEGAVRSLDMFANVLIANRGEIACRIVRTARRMGMRSIAMHTPVDRGALFTRLADEAHEIGEGANGYLDQDAIIALREKSAPNVCIRVTAFCPRTPISLKPAARPASSLSGRLPEAMRTMGLKSSAKALMQRAGVPVVPGYHGDNQNPKFLREKAYEIGYPVLIKAIAGGGGRGMRRVDAHVEFDAALESAIREARGRVRRRAGADREIYRLAPPYRIAGVRRRAWGVASTSSSATARPSAGIRRWSRNARRPDCRRRRAPRWRRPRPRRRWPRATSARARSNSSSIRRAASKPSDFYFLEMNTRLQVEHPVTEAVTGLDLVEWQFRVAAGEPLPLRKARSAARARRSKRGSTPRIRSMTFCPRPGASRS